MEQPFIATYYVDPNFSGTSTGSSDSPFTTIASAFTYALSIALNGAVIFLQPSGIISEDVVFPDHGDWEISCPDTSRLSVISGTVSHSPPTVAAPKYRLTNVTVTGPISGDAASAQNTFLVLTNCKINSSVSLVASGAGSWVLQCIGRCSDANSFGGFIAGAVNVAGAIRANYWSFQSPSVWSDTISQFDSCRVHGSLASTATALNNVRFSDCTFTSAVNIASSGPLVVQADSPSFSSAATLGLVFGSNVTLKIADKNSASQIVPSNTTPLNICGRVPHGMYQCVATIDLLDNVAAIGTAAINVLYTDLSGVLRTVPVASIDTSAPIGSEGAGSHVFATNGATPLQYSVTGITPGAGLSLEVRISVTRMD